MKMKENRPIRKEHKAPEFKFIVTEDSNKKFYAASDPTPPQPGGAALTKINEW